MYKKSIFSVAVVLLLSACVASFTGSKEAMMEVINKIPDDRRAPIPNTLVFVTPSDSTKADLANLVGVWRGMFKNMSNSKEMVMIFTEATDGDKVYGYYAHGTWPSRPYKPRFQNVKRTFLFTNNISSWDGAVKVELVDNERITLFWRDATTSYSSLLYKDK